MSKNLIQPKIDIGRLIIVPLFTLFVVIKIISVYREAVTLDPVSTIKISKLINQLLVLCFYCLVVLLYFIRSAAKSSTASFVVKTVAIISIILPFAIPYLGRASDNFAIMLLANLIAIFGLAISLYSLSVLGRNFSVIPQARMLVRTGPYRIVRHPVYLGELISTFGIVLARLSISAIVVFSLITILVIFRALHEEKLLAGTFPEYDPHFLKRARFIPGIF